MRLKPVGGLNLIITVLQTEKPIKGTAFYGEFILQLSGVARASQPFSIALSIRFLVCPPEEDRLGSKRCVFLAHSSLGI